MGMDDEWVGEEGMLGDCEIGAVKGWFGLVWFGGLGEGGEGGFCC